jgi:hypothetical protein
VIRVICLTVFALLALAELPRSARAQSPTATLFDGKVSVPIAAGKTRHFHVQIRRWQLDADDGEGRPIPFAAFSVVTLSSGRIETTIDGKTEIRTPDEFWTVKAGSVMKVRVLGESAVLQTVIVTR